MNEPDEMSAAAAPAAVRVVLIAKADGSTDGLPVGCYLAYYDPEANDGHGAAEWTDDPARAMTFPGIIAAHTCYSAVPHSRPVRPDGKPNRPLTMFAVMFD
jgi:hypothetical protein